MLHTIQLLVAALLALAWGQGALETSDLDDGECSPAKEPALIQARVTRDISHGNSEEGTAAVEEDAKVKHSDEEGKEVKEGEDGPWGYRHHQPRRLLEEGKEVKEGEDQQWGAPWSYHGIYGYGGGEQAMAAQHQQAQARYGVPRRKKELQHHHEEEFELALAEEAARRQAAERGEASEDGRHGPPAPAPPWWYRGSYGGGEQAMAAQPQPPRARYGQPPPTQKPSQDD